MPQDLLLKSYILVKTVNRPHNNTPSTYTMNGSSTDVMLLAMLLQLCS